MASFENDFYEKHAIKVNEKKLSEKFHVAYMPEGSTPDGYQVYESLTIETGKGAVEIYRDGSAVYTSGGNETENSIEAYSMIGIDTDSKEFKQFQTDIQKSENYNVQTVEKMLETVPQLTAEKQIEKLNAIHHESVNEMTVEFDDIDYAEEFYKHNQPMSPEEMAFDEFIELDNDSDITIENHFDNELQNFERKLEKSKIELAELGRVYTGTIISIDEEKTVQQTKSGVAIIHETKNIAGIEQQEVGQSVKIDYSNGNGKEGVIEGKSSGMERSKDTQIEHKVDKSNEIDIGYPF